MSSSGGVQPVPPQCNNPFDDEDNDGDQGSIGSSLSSVSTASEGSYDERRKREDDGGRHILSEGEGDAPKIQFLRLDEVSFDRSNIKNLNTGERQLFEANVTSHIPVKEREHEKGYRERREKHSRGDLDRRRERDSRDRRQRSNGRSGRDFVYDGDCDMNGKIRRDKDKRSDRDREREYDRSNWRDSTRKHRKESIIDKKAVVVPVEGFQLLTRPATIDADRRDGGATSPPPAPSSTIPLKKAPSRDDLTVQTTSTDSNVAIFVDNNRHLYTPTRANSTYSHRNIIYISNLDPSTTKGDVFRAFADYGKLGKIDIDYRGFGSIEFDSDITIKDILKAYDFNKSTFMVRDRIVYLHEKQSSVFRGSGRGNDGSADTPFPNSLRYTAPEFVPYNNTQEYIPKDDNIK